MTPRQDHLSGVIICPTEEGQRLTGRSCGYELACAVNSITATTDTITTAVRFPCQV